MGTREHRRTRGLGAAPAALTAACTAFAPALNTPAHAASEPAMVAAGDAIATTDANGTIRCTLGYTFTAAAKTYGLTAGHCSPPGPARVTDLVSGATGRFVYAAADHDNALSDDYGLIDFGATAAPAGDIHATPIAGIAEPSHRAIICRNGIRTGTACGQFDGRLVGSQYSTLGMTDSLPGDSGGPVWQPNPDGTATVVGIWLGEHTTAAGRRSGRFSNLYDALDAVSVTLDKT
jgi:streptogrisin B